MNLRGSVYLCAGRVTLADLVRSSDTPDRAERPDARLRVPGTGCCRPATAIPL